MRRWLLTGLAGALVVCAVVVVGFRVRSGSGWEVHSGGDGGSWSVSFTWRRPWWFLEDGRKWPEQQLLMRLTPGKRQAMAWEIDGPPLGVRVVAGAGEVLARELSGSGCVEFTRGEGEHQLRFQFPHGRGEGRISWQTGTTCG
ncbi:MAG: hypothetical protein Q4D96_11400 [Propionibacteriaceae bacterium]|nr:hypothetical protein [Propionibacteriaceae bacterium]